MIPHDQARGTRHICGVLARSSTYEETVSLNVTVLVVKSESFSPEATMVNDPDAW